MLDELSKQINIASAKAGVRPSQSGLQDFLLDFDETPEGPRELAARAIVHFCFDDGEFNGRRYYAVAIVRFLEKASGSQITVQGANDLKNMLAENVTHDALLGWAESNFP